MSNDDPHSGLSDSVRFLTAGIALVAASAAALILALITHRHPIPGLFIVLPVAYLAAALLAITAIAQGTFRAVSTRTSRTVAMLITVLALLCLSIAALVVTLIVGLAASGGGVVD